MRKSEDISELVAALALANLEFSNIIANHEANAGRKKYSYANIADVVAVVRPIISKHGLAIAQGENLEAQRAGFFVCETMLMHRSGQWIETDFEVPTDKMGGVHGTGSSNSYARRYAELAILNLAVEDDDGQTAQRQYKQRQAAKQESWSEAAMDLQPAKQLSPVEAGLARDALRRTWASKLRFLEIEFGNDGERAAVQAALFGFADMAQIPAEQCADKKARLVAAPDEVLKRLITEARLKHTLGAVKTGEVQRG